MKKKPRKITEYDNYISERYEDPEEFDSQSFRSRKLESGDVLTFGCPKGEWDEDKEECNVGMKLQRKLQKKKNSARVLKEGRVKGKMKYPIHLPERVFKIYERELEGEVVGEELREILGEFLVEKLLKNKAIKKAFVTYVEDMGY